MLVGEIFGSSCRLNHPDSMKKFMIILHNEINGQDTEKFPFSFFNHSGKYGQELLTANKRVGIDGEIIESAKARGKNCFTRMKELVYLCQEIKNPLSGIRFTYLLLEATDFTENQEQFLKISASCEK